MEWTRSVILDFIEVYRKNEILWNPRNSYYYNSTKKEEIWHELSESLNIPVEDLKRKMDSLKGSFRREKSRIKNNSGKIRNMVYVSNWYAFDLMQFLDDRDTLHHEVDIKDEYYNEEEDSLVDEINNESTVEDSFLKTQSQQLVLPSVKRKAPDEGELIRETDYIPKEVVVAPRNDESGTFGEHVANKIRKFNDKYRAMAQHQISNILYDLEMEQLNHS